MSRGLHPLLGQWVVTGDGSEGEVDSVRIQHNGTEMLSLTDEYGNSICDGLSPEDVELFERANR
jgi:hypothetical protein